MSLARTFSTPAGTTTAVPRKAADSAARRFAAYGARSGPAGCGIGGAGSQSAAIASARCAGMPMSWLTVPPGSVVGSSAVVPASCWSAIPRV